MALPLDSPLIAYAIVVYFSNYNGWRMMQQDHKVLHLK